jgi:hypothetical protein
VQGRFYEALEERTYPMKLNSFAPRSFLQHIALLLTMNALLIFSLVPSCLAQLNWEGQSGALLTPFAYTSASSSHGFGRPQVAFHYINAGPVLGNEFQASITVGFLKIAALAVLRCRCPQKQFVGRPGGNRIL